MTGQAVTGRSGVVHVCTGAQGPGQGCQVYEAAALRYRTTYDAARQAHAAIAAATEAADVAGRFVSELQDTVAMRVRCDGRVDRTALDDEQHMTHGLAWAAALPKKESRT